jgi:hypothetical protein
VVVHVEGVGEVVVVGDWWQLCYEQCGHETRIPRSGGALFDPAEVAAMLREYFATCSVCAELNRAGLGVVS